MVTRTLVADIDPATFTADIKFRSGRPRVDVSTWPDAQQAIDGAPSGAEVVFPGGTTTTVAGTLVGRSQMLYRGGGPGAVVKLANAGISHVMSLTSKADVVVEDLVFDGNMANCPSGNRGLQVESCTDVTVRNVAAKDCVGAGIAFQGSSRFHLQDSRSERCLYGLLLSSGATLFSVSGIVVTGARATAQYEGGIYAPAASRGTLSACHVSGSAGHGAWIGGGSTDLELHGSTFDNNGTDGSDHRGLTVDDAATSVVCVGCVFSGNAECGAWVSSASAACTFQSCVSRGNNTGNAVGGHGFEIGAKGTRLLGCHAIGQLGNTLTAGNGIYVGGAGHMIVNGCLVEGNYSEGIRVYDGNHSVVTNNVVKNNSQRGVGLLSGIELNASGSGTDLICSNNRCFDDQATKTQQYGILVTATVNNYVITGNNLRGNATGALSDGGGGNKVVANNLLT